MCFNLNLLCLQFFHFSSCARAYFAYWQFFFFFWRLWLYNFPAVKDHKFWVTMLLIIHFRPLDDSVSSMVSFCPHVAAASLLSGKSYQDAVDKLFPFAISILSPSLYLPIFALVHEPFNLSHSASVDMRYGASRAWWELKQAENRCFWEELYRPLPFSSPEMIWDTLPHKQKSVQNMCYHINIKLCQQQGKSWLILRFYWRFFVIIISKLYKSWHTTGHYWETCQIA